MFSDVTEDEFIKLEQIAEQKHRQVIGVIRFSALAVNHIGYIALKDSIRNAVHFLKTNESALDRSGIKSISNDGYSESYDGRTTADIENELSKNIHTWLSGTGLIGAY